MIPVYSRPRLWHYVHPISASETPQSSETRTVPEYTLSGSSV